MLLPIESKMEVFAKTYSKDTGVQILPGSQYCTDGKNIFIVPIDDQADVSLRRKVEVVVYHETGHIKAGDVKSNPKDKIKQRIYNWVRDIAVEHNMETEYPGMKKKWVEFLTTCIKESEAKGPQPDKVYNKLLRVLYMTCRANQLNADFGFKAEPAIQALFNAKLAKFVVPVSTKLTIKDSLEFTEEIYKILAEGATDDPEDDKKDPKKKSKSKKSNEQDKQEEGDNENEDSSNPEDSDQNNGDGDSEEGNSPSNAGGDEEGECDPDGDGAEEDSSPSGQTPDKEAEGDKPAGNGAGDDSPLTDEAKQAAEQAKQEVMSGDDSNAKTIAEGTTDELNEYVQTHKIYRTVPGLKEDIQPIPEQYNWQVEVAQHEAEGRQMVGYVGNKLKRLFISERAPVWQRNLRSGKLDIRKTWKVAVGSQDIMRRKTEGVYEDACVYEVIDHSSSMNGTRSRIAQAILTTVSADLDKLRIPFGAVGFTTHGVGSAHRNEYSKAEDGIRALPVILNHVKGFNEPYRKVRHRFVWPRNAQMTCELPAIEFAAKQLAIRRETKKILFILTDGGTCTGSATLDASLRKAAKDFIQRLLRAGVKVVGIGIQDNEIAEYCPDFIYVQNLNNFAHEFYRKLTQLIL